MEIPHVQLSIDSQNPTDGINQLMKTVRPQWTSIHTKSITGGLTNDLYGVWGTDEKEMILVRIFGSSSGQFINRKTEMDSYKILMPYGCTKPIHATFENGMCYGYVRGGMMNIDMIRDIKYGELIAKELARLHTIPVPENYAPHLDKQATFFHGSREMIKILPKKLESAEDDELYQRTIDVDKFEKALVELENEAKSYPEELVICHHDLINRNIIYNKEEHRAYFIDYEYTGPGYASMDIGFHFICYIGMDDPDFDAFPTKEKQQQFLKIYFEERNKYLEKPVEITDDLLEIWYKRSSKLGLISYFYWGLWLILQHHMNNNRDFGFLEFGCKMIDIFFGIKDETMAL